MLNEFQEDVLESAIEIEPLDSDQFLQVKETLTRIGIPDYRNPEKKVLWQSVHVFHDSGRYYLVHFKHLFYLNGNTRSTNITDVDLDKLDSIAAVLQRWGLVKCVGFNPEQCSRIFVVPYRDKPEWDFKVKFNMARLKKGNFDA